MSSEQQDTLDLGTEKATPETESELETVDTDAPEPSTETEGTEPGEEQPEGSEDDDTIEVDVDGKPEKVKAEEARLGYLRERDYTAKTMALAEKEKSVSARLERLDGATTQGEAILQAMIADYSHEFADDVMAKLSREDPAEYVVKLEERAARQKKLQGHFQQLQQLRAAREEEAEKAQADLAAEHSKRLLEALPDWRDPVKYSTEAAKLRTYLEKAGYQPEDIKGINDSRAVILARKAMLYDELTARAPKGAKAVSGAPPPIAKAPTRAQGPKDPAQMTDKEFAEWRRRQIAQRR